MFPSIITDELSGDPDTAFELGLELGVNHFELRGIHDRRVPDLTSHQRRTLIGTVGEFGVTITAISPGLFKFPFPDRAPLRSSLGWMDSDFHQAWEAQRSLLAEHREKLLYEALEFAVSVGARFLIAFSFSRGGRPGGEPPNGVVELLDETADRAQEAGIELLVENEEGHWADTGERTAKLLERLGSAKCGVNWDPANALIDGDVPYPEGYRHVRHLVRNVHFKDARVFADGNWEICHEGEVDWPSQISALAVDGYAGAIAIEPHLAPRVAATRRGLDRLNAFLVNAGRGG